MSVYEYLNRLEKDLGEQIQKAAGNTEKIFTLEDHLNKMLNYTKMLRGIVDNSHYVIEGEKFDGELVEINGLECLKSEIEDVYLIQPLTMLTANDYDDLMQAVSQIYSKGALKNKCVLVLPYDIHILKAKIKK